MCLSVRVHDLSGAYNLNTALTTPRGSYVARVYRPWITVERLQAIQHLKRQLHTAQIPVILPLVTTTGQSLLVYDQRVVEVEPFLPHEPTAEAWPCYQQAFRFLGQLHTVLAHLSDRATPPAPQVENYGLPHDLIAWIATAKQRLAQRQDARVSAGRAICDRAETLLHEIARWWERVGQFLPSQLIHGDYGVGNLLFTHGQIVAVVDWDFLARHGRLFDLAYALFWMCERLEATNDACIRAWPRVRELVGLYQATAQQPFTVEERQALPIEMARVPLYWIAEAAWLSDPLAAILQRADQVAFAQWLLSHQPTID